MKTKPWERRQERSNSRDDVAVNVKTKAAATVRRRGGGGGERKQSQEPYSETENHIARIYILFHDALSFESQEDQFGTRSISE